MSHRTPWRHDSPLASGLTLIEASAGTGKTFSITDLVVRLVVESHVPIDRILVVTFTRPATAELVDRTRRRLRQGLATLETGAPPEDHALLHGLAGLTGAARERAIEALRAARSSFSEATLSTIHGFCQRMIQANALETSADLGLELRPDQADVLREVADDLVAELTWDASPEAFAFLTRSASKRGCDVTRSRLRDLAANALGDPDLPITPEAPDERPRVPDPPPQGDEALAFAGRLHAWFAAEARRRVLAANAARGEMSYQDLLRHLGRSMTGPDCAVARAIRDRFQVVIIDEFQDTDALQWHTFSTAFAGQPDHALYLIGDPKQAIYGFRGADVDVYLDAREQVPSGRRFTLDTCYRTDGPLLGAVNAVFSLPGAFDSATGIDYQRVVARHRGSRLRLGRPPMEIRWFDASIGPGGAVGKPIDQSELLAVLPRVVAEDIVKLLADDQAKPDDIAVLVRTGRQAAAVHSALLDANVPAVLGSGDSVFLSEAAADLRAWLRAVASPARGSATRTAAITALFGVPGDDLVAFLAGDREQEGRQGQWAEQLRGWRELLGERGFVRVFRDMLGYAHPWDDDAPTTVVERVLSRPDGERRLTDLQHLSELLHAAEAERHLELDGLLAWLESRMAAAAADDEREEVAAPRRLERDADAVEVRTVHSAKGLEWPIVFVPYAWRGERIPRSMWSFVAPGDSGRELVTHHPKSGVRSAATGRLMTASKREVRRLLYVALTRAKHRCVVYHGLGGKHCDVGVSGLGLVLPDPSAVADCPHIEVTPCTSPARRVWPGRPTPHLHDASSWQSGLRFDSWRRHSFSGTFSGHRAVVEPAEDDDAPETAPDGTPVPMAGISGGKRFGLALHETMEHLDFVAVRDAATEDDARALVAAAASERLEAHGYGPDDHLETVTTGLLAALRTPLHPSLGDLRLCDVSDEDRLNELSFDLPLPDVPRGREESDALALGNLRGYVTGEIDLVLRAPDGRFWVVDYKSNKVAARGETPTPATYAPERLAAEVAAHTYERQYTLYTLALHRFLRARLPTYDGSRSAYEAHVGGVLYLFLRGMLGPEHPHLGVHHDVVPWETLERLDSLLATPELS